MLEITSDNNVQSLETLGKLKDVTGNARSVLDKLKGVKADQGTDNAGKQGAKFCDRENILCKRNNAITKRVCLL